MSPEAPGFETRALEASLRASLFTRAEPVRIGRFEITGKLGRGGMGVVFRARDPQLGRDVAVKVLARQVLGSTPGARRLQKEARALARLAHSNVVSVLDVGIEDGQTFVAMELVEGGTLADWCDRNPVGAPGRDRALLDLLEQACSGLAAAHRAGLVHRDVKPGNMLVGRDGRLRLADFGLARASITPVDSPDSGASGGSDATRGGAGTPAYMAPEQFEGDATPACDQFSVCVSFCQAAGGRLPFAGATPQEIAASIRGGQLAIPHSVHPGLAAILRRGMAHDPGDRYAALDELLADVRRLKRPRGRLWLGVGALAVAATAAAAFAPAPANRCAEAPRELGRTWAQARAQLADQDSAAVERADAYVAGWTDSYASACEAAWEHGTLGAVELDQRMRCLGRGRAAMVALAAQFDPRAVGALPELADCEDASVLAGQAPRTTDPEVLAEIQEMSEVLAAMQVQKFQGPIPEAARRADALLTRAIELGDPWLAYRAAWVAADLHWAHDPAQSLSVLDRGLRVVDQAGYEHLTVRLARGAFGAAVASAGDVKGARLYLRQAEARLARIDDPERAARERGGLLSAQALELRKLGQREAALAKAAEALAAHEATGNVSSQGDTLRLMGELKLDLSQYDASKRHLERSIELVRPLPGSGGQVAEATQTLGRLAAETGDVQGAQRHAQELLAFALQHAGPGSRQVMGARSTLADARLSAGDREGAHEQMELVREIADAVLPPEHPYRSQNRVNLAMTTDDLERREALLREAADLSLEYQGAQSFAHGFALYERGKLARTQGDHAHAVEWLETALAIFERVGRTQRAAGAHRELARALLAAGRLEDARVAAAAGYATAESAYGEQSSMLVGWLLARAEIEVEFGAVREAEGLLQRGATLAERVPAQAENLVRIRELQARL